ncbi:prolyl aminopeptidase [Aestuariibacter sp. A3R04]|uniref:prolyl aminopeptidase n=1 Tax=Aestuariibacter sp. A3R04 TaxID=2841571 RepID=UPI001C08348B|nr:prolyl aminopeptidase [Aestuariibacter sp. A3R04]MBU3023887.1 prolyl aminopeptidase [Aestuariibacter sp. A3R04]
MKRLYPDIGCYSSGYLETPDGHCLYFEESGNPDGFPVLYLHGGPGAGLATGYRRFFDANRYRIIGFDQRGCGRSKPFGSLDNNTTQHSLGDISLLRKQLGIHQWLLFGGSWGATLALLAAIAEPQSVTGMILRGVFLARQSDRDWFLSENGAAATLFPDHYATFTQGLTPPFTTKSVCEHYQKCFESADEVQRMDALKRWYVWEERLSKVSLPPGTGDVTCHYPINLMTSLAKLECHYLANQCFIPEGYILENIEKISHIPTTIVHGRYDVICSTKGAYTLHTALRNSTLQIVQEAGHSTSEPGIGLALCRATRDMSKFLKEKQQ